MSSKVWSYSEEARGLWKDAPEHSASLPVLAMKTVVDSSKNYCELNANNPIYTQRTNNIHLRKPKKKCEKKKQLFGEVSSHGFDLPAPATTVSTPMFICRRRFRQRVTCLIFPPNYPPPNNPESLEQTFVMSYMFWCCLHTFSKG